MSEMGPKGVFKSSKPRLEQFTFTNTALRNNTQLALNPLAHSLVK